jgi:hypothetical protein
MPRQVNMVHLELEQPQQHNRCQPATGLQTAPEPSSITLALPLPHLPRPLLPGTTPRRAQSILAASYHDCIASKTHTGDNLKPTAHDGDS